ncbi:MAG TPA: DUF1990 domain-containing protein [Pirellulaceae bacterium]|nr:DUF1990 domain-containing protein [Pirellulaceae bacterium]
MLRFTRPTVEQIRAYLDAQRGQPFSYREVGATREAPPTGYDFDQHRVLLGFGWERFCEARSALQHWAMFPATMTRLYWPDAPLEVGVTVAVLFRAGPIWSLNPARIVYVVDETNVQEVRYGFAYGTLPDHVEQGEERFLLHWDRVDNRVWYEIAAFSRPQHYLAKWLYVYMRCEQARFRKLSGLAMQRAMRGKFVEPLRTNPQR